MKKKMIKNLKIRIYRIIKIIIFIMLHNLIIFDEIYNFLQISIHL